MGIKRFKSYLNSKPKLKHSIEFINRKQKRKRNLIIWDVLGFMENLFGCYRRETKLLFDFGTLHYRIKHTIQAFGLYGFKLIAFIDGYHIDDKNDTIKARMLQKVERRKQQIALIKQLHDNNLTKSDKDEIIKKIEWMPSSGYTSFLANILRSHGVTVYRGSGQHDIDQDIATFAYLKKKKVYGIISRDTDFFGFCQLPANIKLIIQYKTMKKKLSFIYYDRTEAWNSLKLKTQENIFKFISFVGNDFVDPKYQYNANQPYQTVNNELNDDEKSNQIQSTETKPMDSEELERKLRSRKNTTNPQNDVQFKAAFVPHNNDNVGDEEKKYNHDRKGPHIFEEIANEIVTNSMNSHIKIDDAISKFYKIRKNDKISSFKTNENMTWINLEEKHVFSAGCFFHDMEAVGFTIHDKLARIRKVIIKNNMDLDEYREMIGIYKKKQAKFIASQPRIINLSKISIKKCDLKIKVAKPLKSRDKISAGYLVGNVLNILWDKHWVTKKQYNALELQFKFRNHLRAIYRDYDKWPFDYKLFMWFKENGVARICDLTAQCLYWQLCRWISFGPIDVMPNISQLFHGPLFHFFCHVQSNMIGSKSIIDNLQKMVMDNKRLKGIRSKPRRKQPNQQQIPVYSQYIGKYSDQRVLDNEEEEVYEYVVEEEVDEYVVEEDYQGVIEDIYDHQWRQWEHGQKHQHWL